MPTTEQQDSPAGTQIPGALPRVRHALMPGEDPVAALARVARSLAFAFHIDPTEAAGQPEFDLASESVVLPEGVVARTSLRGRYTLTRDAARIAATGADQLFVFFVEGGLIDVLPTRTGQPVMAGDILIVDLARTITLLQTGHTYTVLVIARGMLPDAVQHRELNGCVVPASHALAGVVSCCAHRLWDDSRRMAGEQASAVLRSTVDLLGLALADVSRPGRTTISVKATVESLVDNNLGHHDLSPAWIAQRLGISRATLYRALDAYGGVRSFIADRRLHRAWTLVSSPAGPPMEAIAAECGYGSARRMAQVFERAFGIKPIDVRVLDDDARYELECTAAEKITSSWEKRTSTDAIETGA